MYDRLLSPITINGMELKNRMVMPALHHLYTEGGACTARFSDYYARRAAGGVGLIIVGACRFDDYGAKENCMSLHTDGLIGSWQAFTHRIHGLGCKAAVQLYHAGRYIRAAEAPAGRALAPSPVYSAYSRETPCAMTADEIAQVRDCWAQAARRAREAGFDAVEILGSAGYLLAQFLSPVTNLRTDEYGGSWENRCRFPLSVIAAVRRAVGPDYPIFYRLGGSDFIPGSNTNQEAAAFAALAQAAGVDCFNVTGGWHETRVPQLTGDVPPGGLSYLAQGIKGAVTVPVIACNRLDSPQVCEETLALGRADLIGLGRPLLADPDFPQKAAEGRAGLIRPCLACNEKCLAHTFFDRPIACAVNPGCGLEYLPRPSRPSCRRILVAGGGPAGCQAALTLAGGGHRVTLWERTDRLGGQLNLAALLPARQNFARLISYFKTALAAAGVTVVYEKALTPEFEGEGFDQVILAVGGAPNQMTLPMEPGHIPVLTLAQVLEGHVPGQTVAVAGGSYIGCLAAQLLARRGSLSPQELYYLSAWKGEPWARLEPRLMGSDRRVILLERGKKAGFGFPPGTSWPVMADLGRLGVEKHTNTVITAVTSRGVLCQREGEAAEFTCDTVVTHLGVHPDSTLGDALAAKGIPVRAAGNCRRLGKAADAIADGCALLTGQAVPTSETGSPPPPTGR